MDRRPVVHPARRGVIPAIFAALFALWAGFGCRPTPQCDYTVRVSDPGRGAIEVALEVSGVDPSTPFVLEARTDPSAVRFSRVVARAGDRALALAESSETGARTRLAFEAPRASRVTVRYAVTLPPPPHGAEAGESRPSAIGARFALVRGRDFLLVPETNGRWARPRVGFALPAGWRAHAPWIARPLTSGESARPEYGMPELLATPIGLGHFVERRFRIERTNYRLWFESGTSEAEIGQASEQMRAVSSHLAEAFARPLGPLYTAIVTPALDPQGSPHGSSWGTGQGGARWPLTTSGLRAYARALANAYLLDPPHRFEFTAKSDLWLVSALREFLATEAVARVRHIPQAEVDRALAYAYATLPETAEDALALERIALPSPKDETERLVAEGAGPYVLRRLERELADESSQQPSPVRVALAHASRSARVRSFWDGLPGGESGRARAFLARYVRDGEVLDVSPDRESWTWSAVPLPVPRAAGPPRSVAIAITAQTLAHLEPCGCKASDSGGMARRFTLLERLRRAEPELVLLDAGSAFSDPTKLPALDAFGRAEQTLYLELMGALRYDACAIGLSELARGTATFVALSEGAAPLPYALSNLARGGRPLAPAQRVFERGGISVRVIGAYDPPGRLSAPAALERSLDSVQVADPVEAVARAARASTEAELVVVLGELSSRTVRRIVERCPTVDVIVTAPDRMRGELAPNGGLGGTLDPASAFLGKTYVMYSDLGEYGVKTLALELTGEGRVARAEPGQIDLDAGIAPHAATRARLDSFYARMATADAAVAAVEVPFARDPTRNAGGYAGQAACVPCHAREAEQWEQTPHASAFKTLLDVHRASQPRCVACHVVGYGTRDGYALDRKSAHLEGVQCETCHGPGAAHARAPSRGTIARAVPEAVCRSCHTPEHSDAFHYADRLPRVWHRDRGDLAVKP